MFSDKEKDEETGYHYFGARYYDSDLSIWLSVDPMAGKYPSLSPYTYCANNPVMLIDPDGNYFVGFNNKQVRVRENNNGKLRLGMNATRDLRRMARMINRSGSQTGKSQYLALSENKTKIHFSMSKERAEGMLMGYHQPHDASGRKLEYDPDAMIFDGMPAYILDANGNNVYKEASITIYENNISSNLDFLHDYFFDHSFNAKEAAVGVFSHEADHNLDQETINSIRDRQMGIENYFNEEIPADRKQRATYREIRNKKNEH
jgi:RHS repeat-associated protein